MTDRMSRDDMKDVLDAIEALGPDGHENALIGIMERFGGVTVALYDKDIILENLIGAGCSPQEAVEYFDFNIIGAWVGGMTPAFASLADDVGRDDGPPDFGDDPGPEEM